MRLIALCVGLGWIASSPGTVSAQLPLDAGTWGIGGSTRIALSLDGNQSTAWGIDLAPQVTHFLLPGLAASVTLRGAYYSFGAGSKRLLAAGPGLTWYPVARQGSFVPFVGTGLLYGQYTEALGDTPSRQATGFEWQTSGGVMFRVGRSVGLQAGVQYGPSRFRFDRSARARDAAPRRLQPAVGLEVFF